MVFCYCLMSEWSTRIVWWSVIWCDSWIPTSFLVAQMVESPVIPETRVWPLSQEDPLEKGMGTHSNILAWKIPWTQKPGVLQSVGSQSPHDWVTNTFTKISLRMFSQTYLSRYISELSMMGNTLVII